MKKMTFRYTAKAPISHGGEETLSVITPFRRQTVIYNNKNIDIPVLSGNGFRGGVLRRGGMKKVCDLLGIGKEGLTLKAYHMLFNGGALTKGDDKVDIGKRISIREKLPFLSVLGGGIGNVLLEGRLNVGFIYPVAKETEYITDIESDKSVFEYLDTIFYTRREDYEGTTEGDTMQMKYEAEILIPGTPLYQEIVSLCNTKLEESALSLFIEEFKKHPYIGGKSNVGHGYVEVEQQGELESSEAVEQYIEANKEDIIDYLNSM